MRARLGALIAVLAFAQSSVACAQADEDERNTDLAWSFSASDTKQSDADFDNGGQVGLWRSSLALSARRQLESGLNLGASFRYTLDRWDFSDPAAFGGVAPWQDIHRASVGMQLRGRFNENWQWIAAPMLQYAGEDGAKSADAMSYGAAFGFTRRFGSDLDLVLGVAALHDIDENRVRPYLAVNWKINEHWRLGSPESAAPSGLAGFELSYRRDSAWDIGVGVGYSEYRFRLDDHGPTAGGVGESRSLPLYGRVSFRPNNVVRFDAYAGASFDNRLRTEYADGGGIVSEKYATAPLFGLAVVVSP